MADEQEQSTPVADWRDAYTNVLPGEQLPAENAGDSDKDVDPSTAVPLEIFPFNTVYEGLPEPRNRAGRTRTTHVYPVQVHEVVMDTKGGIARSAPTNPDAFDLHPAFADDEKILDQTDGVLRGWKDLKVRSSVRPMFENMPHVVNSHWKTFLEPLSQVRMVVDDKLQRWAGAVLRSKGSISKCSQCGSRVHYNKLERNDANALVCKPGYDDFCKQEALNIDDDAR